MKIFGSINLIEWNPHTNTGPLSTTTIQLNRLGRKRVRWISTECPPSLSVRPLSGFKLSKRLLKFRCQVQSKNSEIQFRWISGHWRSEMQSVLHILGEKSLPSDPARKFLASLVKQSIQVLRIPELCRDLAVTGCQPNVGIPSWNFRPLSNGSLTDLIPTVPTPTSEIEYPELQSRSRSA